MNQATTRVLGLACALSSLTALGVQANNDIVEAHSAVITTNPSDSEKVTSERALLGSLKSAEARNKTYTIHLPPLSAHENQSLKSKAQTDAKKVPIGILRTTQQLPMQLGPELEWLETAAGGRIATVEISSPEAKSTRLQISTAALPEGAELRFAADRDLIPSAQSYIVNHSTDTIFWSPSVDSDSVVIDIYLPAEIEHEGAVLEILAVMHQMIHADTRQLDYKDLSDLGWSGSCEVDAACPTGISQDYDSTRTATAKITYVDGGYAYLCSGTLMNDLDTSTEIPYLLTANHCIDNQSSASSAEFYWFFSRSACGYGDPAIVTRTSGGATLLSNNAEVDYSFMRLNSLPPNGAALAGWTTRDARSTYVYGVHHPQGDVKKVSQGNTESYYDYFYNTPNTHLLVYWQSGVTEGGSSGSGLWVTDGSQSQLVGLLTGGASSCAAPDYPDLYGRFDLAFPQISNWLAETSGDGSDPVVGQVNISGNVSVAGLPDTPVVALVLANGSFAFSLGGEYSINAPVDAEGKITLFAWADGFTQYKKIFTPIQNAVTQDISIAR